MQRLPPAEDAEEEAMDRVLATRAVRINVGLRPAIYGRLLAEQYRRRITGNRCSLRTIVETVLDRHLPAAE